MGFFNTQSDNSAPTNDFSNSTNPLVSLDAQGGHRCGRRNRHTR